MNRVMPYCFGHRSVIQSGIDAATPPSDLLAGAKAIRAAQNVSVQCGASDGVCGGANGRAVRGKLHDGREWHIVAEYMKPPQGIFKVSVISD